MIVTRLFNDFGNVNNNEEWSYYRSIILHNGRDQNGCGDNGDSGDWGAQ